METNDPIRNRRRATSHSRPSLPDIAKPHAPVRKHGYDNLRTFLTALVILHHTAIVYGGVGGWEVRSKCFPPESAILIAFNAIDQSFFMALFFFMSGHFTQIQISKRNPMRFTVIRTRFLRILLPAVISTFLIPPTLIVMAWVSGRGGTYGAPANFSSIYYYYWTHLRGVRGSVWYLALVMAFDTITILFPWGDNNHRQQKLKNAIVREKRIWVPMAWMITILSGFAIRVVYPVGEIWTPLSLQLAYLPQYVLAYVGGHLSALISDPFILVPFHHNTMNASRRLFSSLVIMLCSLGLSAVLAKMTIGIEDKKQFMELARGGLNIPALIYAVWGELGFALTGFSLVNIFLRHGDFPWTWRSLWLPRFAYGAFLLHPVVSVGIELALEFWMGCHGQAGTSQALHYGIWTSLGPVLLTIVAGLLNIVGSWIASWVLLSTVPVANKVIW